MGRKRVVQTPGAAPVADAPDTPQTGTEAQGQAEQAAAGTAADEILEPVIRHARAAIVRAALELPDPTTLAAPVLTERGWLCPSPKPAD